MLYLECIPNYSNLFRKDHSLTVVDHLMGNVSFAYGLPIYADYQDSVQRRAHDVVSRTPGLKDPL